MVKKSEPNRQYKDSMFTKLFGKKAAALELYNAIAGTSYDENTNIEMNTLGNILYMGIRNDVSFIIDDRLVVLVEHQSTINENLPVRLLLYIAKIYDSVISDKDVYRKDLIKLPRPEFIVLYNGAETMPNKKILKLSKAYELGKNKGKNKIMLDLEVPVYNINKGHNDKIVSKGETLRGYVEFMASVREYKEQGDELNIAIKKAIEACVKRGILVEFLHRNATEVMGMLNAEFNMELAQQVWKEEGERKGMREGVMSTLSLMERGLSVAEVKKQLLGSTNKATKSKNTTKKAK
ncbi:Rpn family recombination-promoting nuclease/putative transposase [Deferribacterales bacterium RsTz2092]|nr:hypothetical protein AGMMS49941_06610 [Deferribacterales bacterium]